MSQTVAEMNREAWLTKLASEIVPMIEPLAKAQYGQDWQMPLYRLTAGFPSQRALSRTKKRIGECWTGRASADGAFEIIVSPLTIQNVEKEWHGIAVAGTVAHELVHAADRVANSHKGPFVRIVRQLGLTGKPTATTEGPEFIAKLNPILAQMPPLPFVEFNASQHYKKQKTAMIRCKCPVDGYILRTTEKWLAEAIPKCPICSTEMKVGN